MKKFSCLFLALIMILSSCGIKEKQNPSSTTTSISNVEKPSSHPPYADVEYARMPLAELTKQSPLILLAECLAVRDNTEAEIYETTFSVKEILRGTYTEKSIVVDSYAEEYKVGGAYYLFLDEFISVFYTHSHYMAASIPVQTNGPYNEGITDINDLTEHELKEKIQQTIRANSYEGTGFIGTPFTKSTEPAEVFEASEYVLKVFVKSVESRTKDRMAVECEVKDQLKGTFGSGFLAVVPLGSVQPGGEYILMLNRSSEQSRVFVVSSLSSVAAPDSEIGEQLVQLSARFK